MMQVRDNLLRPEQQKQVYDFLDKPGWEWGWKSKRKTDVFSFAHKHFAGHRKVGAESDQPYECADELKRNAPLLWQFWTWLAPGHLRGHRLIRCYANGMPYGCDGTVHWDDKAPNAFTTIYYPHLTWSPNWGGETIWYSKDESKIIGSVLPNPNQLVTFQGMIPHRAAGVSRQCPVMRITLMFKTDVPS